MQFHNAIFFFSKISVLLFFSLQVTFMWVCAKHSSLVTPYLVFDATLRIGCWSRDEARETWKQKKILGRVGIFLDCFFFFSFWIVLHSVHGDNDMTHSASFLAFLPAMISQDFKGGDNWILSRCWVPPVHFKAGSRVSQKVGIDPGLALATMFCQKGTWVVSRNAETMTSLSWGALSVLILCVQHAHQELLPGFVLKFNLSLPYQPGSHQKLR